MKERPILFSGPMVRAILDGKKTQTRRVCKVEVIQVPDGMSEDDLDLSARLKFLSLTKCPYGQPGDQLWVKETFMHFGNEWISDNHGLVRANIKYQADGLTLPRGAWSDFDEAPREKWWNTGKHPWKPSIFMPRWASRLTLEIVSVRVERLLKITLSDIWDEGRGMPPDIDDSIEARQREWVDGPAWYRKLWDSLNAKKHPWQSNPWVWVIEFKVVSL